VKGLKELVWKSIEPLQIKDTFKCFEIKAVQNDRVESGIIHPSIYRLLTGAL